MPIGSWSSKNNTWMWAWANNSLAEELKLECIQFKGLADFTGFDIFEKEEFEADEGMADDFGIILTKRAVKSKNISSNSTAL